LRHRGFLSNSEEKIGVNGFHLPFVSAGQCRSRLCQMLETGGLARRFDGRHTFFISHLPEIHRPINRLPFAFNKLQPHLIELRIYLGESWGEPNSPSLIHRHLYKKGEMGVAIDAFLRGSQPDDAIVIS